ncbi:IS91 family transposase [Maritimibacter sp. 55A14]|uniref:IS91 family transposase n=1 Tax=Maritimibacter sp. 55A14 TaxID=2174844 RepID=UPI000D61B48F|nr:IS91 family transposase [Maritimibacter sp. 55A14]PWE28380.1 IS91 family transposase [Maritimibacter sp. 55A14]
MPQSRLEVAGIFRAHGPAWRAANAGHVSLDQLKVMSAIERCRTAALGGHVARCEDCGREHIAYNSCRNRHCPKCQAGAAKAWLTAREAELLPVRYFHLVFTLPKPVADIAHQNKRELYNLLMRASADTVIRIATDPKHLGARVGVTSVLHTWGSAMTHHPHVHMIVPGGGLSADSTRWIACRRNFFLSVRVLSRLYRRLVLDGLARLHTAGKLHFFGGHAELVDRAAFDAFLQPLRKIDWVVYAKEPFAGPGAVLAYLSRYTHRVAISNSRLIRVDDQSVTFRVKDYRVNGPGRHTTMTLKADEFIRRFLIHVLPKGQHRIRHYGFFGNGNRAANIARIRELLGAERGRACDDTVDDTVAHRGVLALPCPCCGGQLIIVETIAPQRHPRAPPGTARAAA